MCGDDELQEKLTESYIHLIPRGTTYSKVEDAFHRGPSSIMLTMSKLTAAIASSALLHRKLRNPLLNSSRLHFTMPSLPAPISDESIVNEWPWRAVLTIILFFQPKEGRSVLEEQSIDVVYTLHVTIVRQTDLLS